MEINALFQIKVCFSRNSFVYQVQFLAKFSISPIVHKATLHSLLCFVQCVKSESESGSVMSNSLRPHGLYSPWNSPGQSTGVGSLSLLQGIFPTQGWKPGLLYCRQILYQLSHLRNPRILKWVAYPFSRGSFQLRNRTRVLLHCRWILYQLSYQGSRLLNSFFRLLTDKEFSFILIARIIFDSCLSFYVLCESPSLC